MKIDFSCCKTHSFYSVLPPLLSLLPPLFPGFLFFPPISFIFLFFPRMIKDSFSFFLFLFCLRLFEGVSGITSHQRSGTFCFRLFSDRFFLVACYATLQPALLVHPSVRPSVGPSHFTFWGFLRSLASLLLPKWLSDLKYSPCPTTRNWGSRVSGHVDDLLAFFYMK